MSLELNGPMPQVWETLTVLPKWRNTKMKLYLIFTLIDLLIVLAYPIVYIVHLARKLLNSRQ
jgi:hypothetical protein